MLLIACVVFAAPDDSQQKVLLNPDSNPHAVLMRAFYESGYAEQDAADLATRAIGIIKGEQVEPTLLRPTRQVGTVPLHPDSNPHAVLYQMYLESGWPSGAAVQHANTATMLILGIEPGEWELQPLGNDCLVYSVSAVTCEDGEPVRGLYYIGRNCYDEMELCATQLCPSGQANWFTVETGGNCMWVSAQNSNPLWVPCSSVAHRLLKCSDFESTDCSDLQPECCSEKYGCAGCPDCD